MTHQTHAYHIVNPSPWPLMGALSALLITSGLIMWFHYNSISLLTLGLTTNILTMCQWWQDVIWESTFQGHHTPIVQKGLCYGIILLIVSEVFFFAGFFWAFYHSSLAPTPKLGGCWLPTGIIPLNLLEVPLLNTSVLLASGVSITWAHHSLIEENCKHILQALFITISLGVYSHSFKPPNIMRHLLQFLMESMAPLYSYWVPRTTCNHWFYIPYCLLSPTIILPLHIKSSLRIWSRRMILTLVDIVWLFLYVSIYWWGSYFFSRISTIDFQSVSFRLTLKRSNKHNINPNNQCILSIPTCNNCILTPSTKYLCRQGKSLWMQLWPYGILTSTLFHKIFPSGHHILTFRNCTAPPASLSITKQTKNNTHGTSTNLFTSRSLAYEWTEKGLELTEYDN